MGEYADGKNTSSDLKGQNRLLKRAIVSRTICVLYQCMTWYYSVAYLRGGPEVLDSPPRTLTEKKKKRKTKNSILFADPSIYVGTRGHGFFP